MMNHINSCHSKNEMNMPGFVRCELINLYKHVRTWNSKISDASWYKLQTWYYQPRPWFWIPNFDMILKTCPDLSRYYDKIWYNFKTYPDLSKYYNTIWYDSKNMSRLVKILWYAAVLQRVRPAIPRSYLDLAK